MPHPERPFELAVEEVVLEERAASEEEAIAEPEAVSDGDETMAAKKKKKRKKKPKATDHQHPEETSSMDPEQQAEIQRVVAEAMEKAMSKWSARTGCYYPDTLLGQ